MRLVIVGVLVGLWGCADALAVEPGVYEVGVDPPYEWRVEDDLDLVEAVNPGRWWSSYSPEADLECEVARYRPEGPDVAVLNFDCRNLQTFRAMLERSKLGHEDWKYYGQLRDAWSDDWVADVEIRLTKIR